MVNLGKGEGISLSKHAPGLSKVDIGLGWDPAKKKGFFGFAKAAEEIDLDASCLLFDGQANLLDTVWFRQLQSKDGSVQHSGDNRTGEGDGDDEIISIELGALPAAVMTLVVTVNSFKGQTFDEVDNAYLRFVDAGKNAEIAKFDLHDKGRFTGVVMGVLSRKSGSWEFKAIGEPQNGSTVNDLVASAARYA